jgi:acetamidase/formamidase
LGAFLAVSLVSAHFYGPCNGAEAIPPSNLQGTWELSWTRYGETNVDRIQLTVDGQTMGGRIFGNLILQGTVIGDDVEVKALNSEKKVQATLKGKIEQNHLSGDMDLDNQKFPWSAQRPAVRPPNAPKIHSFQPTRFHNHFSGTIPPVLRLFPGDTVRTETVDAGGYDKGGVQRARGGNPLTGPFYIEGAIPGDTLVIEFTRVGLNRDTAKSGSSIVPIALEPGYLLNQKRVKDFDSTWRLDRELGVAKLAKPSENLKDFTVPLRPMLGCVGVAPGLGQSIASGDLGNYGGNMDFNHIQEGTTLYLPVLQQGALLFLGDGHVAQGDGELTGDALETSMDVEFKVDLLPGKSFGGPRAVNEEYIMKIGIATSLPQALQEATTRLARWLVYHPGPQR